MLFLIAIHDSEHVIKLGSKCRSGPKISSSFFVCFVRDARKLSAKDDLGVAEGFLFLRLWIIYSKIK